MTHKPWTEARRRTDVPIVCRRCLDSGTVDGIYTGWCDCETGKASKAWSDANPTRSPYDFRAPAWEYADKSEPVDS